MPGASPPSNITVIGSPPWAGALNEPLGQLKSPVVSGSDLNGHIRSGVVEQGYRAGGVNAQALDLHAKSPWADLDTGGKRAANSQGTRSATDRSGSGYSPFRR